MYGEARSRLKAPVKQGEEARLIRVDFMPPIPRIGRVFVAFRRAETLDYESPREYTLTVRGRTFQQLYGLTAEAGQRFDCPFAQRNDIAIKRLSDHRDEKRGVDAVDLRGINVARMGASNIFRHQYLAIRSMRTCAMGER